MFIYLAALGLSCGKQDPLQCCAGFSLVARGLICPVVCGILVPWSGIDPRSPRIGRQILNHWTTREVPNHVILNVKIYIIWKKKQKSTWPNKLYFNTLRK